MTLELVPLCTVTVELAEAISVSPTLIIGEVSGVVVEGARFHATMKGRAVADWLRVSPDGYGTIDVRMTLETHDGAVVFVSYSGRLDFTTMTAYATPQFHTGDERYAWLNRVQAVAKGVFGGTGLVYEMYELV